MKELIYILIILILNLNLIAQPNIQVSEYPTADELTELFRRTTAGEFDPFEVIPIVVERGDNAIDALEEFLFTEPNDSEYVQNPDSSFIINDVEPNKVYAVLALDGISTPIAEQILMYTSQNHPEIKVRGAVIQVFAWNRFYRAQQLNETPDKEILHLLINNADDTTYVEELSGRIGKIAREGIRNWTGQDYGELPENMDPTMIEYRELLWQQNSNGIVWDNETKQFIMNY